MVIRSREFMPRPEWWRPNVSFWQARNRHRHNQTGRDMATYRQTTMRRVIPLKRTKDDNRATTALGFNGVFPYMVICTVGKSPVSGRWPYVFQCRPPDCIVRLLLLRYTLLLQGSTVNLTSMCGSRLLTVGSTAVSNCASNASNRYYNTLRIVSLAWQERAVEVLYYLGKSRKRCHHQPVGYVGNIIVNIAWSINNQLRMQLPFSML